MSGYLFDHQIRDRVCEPPAEQSQHWLQNLGLGQRFAGATGFPPPMTMGSLADAQFQKLVVGAKQMAMIIALD